jgi:hypothetical protein
MFALNLFKIQKPSVHIKYKLMIYFYIPTKTVSTYSDYPFKGSLT